MATDQTPGSPLMEDSEVLRAVFKNLTVGVIVCDLQGQFVYFSPEAERILGVGAMNIKASEWATAYGCYLPDMHTPYPSEQLALARAMRGEDALHELIYIRNPSRPAGLWIDVSATPLWDSSGESSGAVVLIADISVPENMLRNSAAVVSFLNPVLDTFDSDVNRRDLVSERFAQFRTMYQQLARVVEQTDDSILITDKRGIIEYVNPAFEKITGYAANEVLGQRPSILKSGEHDAGFYRDLWDRLNAGDGFQGMIVNRKKSGDLFWSEQTISLIKDQAGRTTHFVSVLKDMTARRKLREQQCHLEFAREIQQRYYSTTALLPGFDIAAAAYPAHETGGDYFDFIPQPDGSLYIVVADIAGHGIGSALVMAETRAYLRAYATLTTDMPALLNCVNHSLLSSLGGNRFVTMFLGRIDPDKRTLEYVSAGHEAGYLLRGSGELVAVLGSSGQPLGILPNQLPCLSNVTALEQGDAIILLTDGVIESVNAENNYWGADGVMDFIRCRQQHTAQEIVHGLYLAARTFSGDGPQLDDMLSVVCKVR